MLIRALVILATLLATGDAVSAGPKGPRAKASLPRASSNASSALSLNVRTETGVRNATAPYLYGWMFEDINHSGDGGIYGELLTNRAFDGSNVNWGTVPGDTSIVYQENTCNAYGML
jgi:alpha-N-arabinofuranosidase